MWSVLLVALAIRIAWVAHTHSYFPVIDAADYNRIAHSIASGHGYPPSEFALGPSAYRPPGYPYFLGLIYWITGGGWPLARYLECVLGTLTVALTGLIAFRIWGARIGWITLLLAALFPPMVVSSTDLLSEALFVPLELGAVAAILRARQAPPGFRWVALGGVLAGLAALTRGNGFLLLLPLLIGVWTMRPQLSRQALVAPALLLGVAAVCLAPWTIRNASVMHAFVPVTSETGLTVAGTYNDTSARSKVYPPTTWVPPSKDPNLAPLFAQKFIPNYRGPRMNELEVNSRLESAALHYAKSHPSYVLKVVYYNTARLTGLSGDPHSLIDQEEPALPGNVGFISFYVLAALALYGWFAEPRKLAPSFIFVVPLMMATVVFATGWTRYRAPIDPFIVLLTAIAIETILARRKRSAKRRPSSRDGL